MRPASRVQCLRKAHERARFPTGRLGFRTSRPGRGLHAAARGPSSSRSSTPYPNWRCSCARSSSSASGRPGSGGPDGPKRSSAARRSPRRWRMRALPRATSPRCRWAPEWAPRSAASCRISAWAPSESPRSGDRRRGRRARCRWRGRPWPAANTTSCCARGSGPSRATPSPTARCCTRRPRRRSTTWTRAARRRSTSRASPRRTARSAPTTPARCWRHGWTPAT